MPGNQHSTMVGIKLMNPVRIFTHIACEPPGYLEVLINRLGYPHEQICLYDGVDVPMALDSIAGLVLMGGPGNVNQPTDWMRQEIELIRIAIEQDLPILGICLGAQLMSKALGGEVQPGKAVEVGWHEVGLEPRAKFHPCFATLPEKVPVFQWHAHVFTPPPGAEILATNECADCQAFAYGNSLAVQFHLEMTEPIIRILILQYGGDLEGNSDCNQNSVQILEDITSRSRQVNTMADAIFTPWFQALYA